MPVEERAKNVHITLEKACRLEEMINEFFEITRYNSHQIRLSECSIDLYYMLVQLTDELTPVLKHHGNFVTLEMDEDMVVYADPDKLARVFGNLLKNAAAYSYRGTEIIISAFQTETETKIFIKNRGDTIPEEQLSLVFDKFYCLDQSRSSGTGGTGLGLAIAKDIIELHGGSSSASSEADAIVFCIQLPIIVSGYRTQEKQQELFEDKIREYKKMGYSKEEAEELAEQWVARPGTSEHEMGLAVDINGEIYDVYLWLQKNCYKYGFIFRYPGAKTDLTGVAEEVWHYRYVGEEAAARIQEEFLCLEEYLENREES